VYPLDQTADAAQAVQQNLSEGKLGVLCLAPEEGLGVTDPELREQHIDQITLFRRFEDGAAATGATSATQAGKPHADATGKTGA
jgi:hypothetical protein